MIELRLVGYGSHGRSIAQASKELADSIQIVVVLDIDTSKHSEIVKGSAVGAIHRTLQALHIYWRFRVPIDEIATNDILAFLYGSNAFLRSAPTS